VDLLEKWRARAAQLEPYAPAVAHVLRECAQELEAAQKAMAIDTVSPAEASLIGGYCADAIGKMLRDGRLQNFGNKRRPRILRSAIPIKPGYRRERGPDLMLLAVGGAR
jgi:hypothetical protein